MDWYTPLLILGLIIIGGFASIMLLMLGAFVVWFYWQFITALWGWLNQSRLAWLIHWRIW